MISSKYLFILTLLFFITSRTLAQTFQKYSPQVADKGRIMGEFSLDGDIENNHLYKNIPKDFTNFKSSYLYIDLVQGIYEKLMLETQQPEKWEKFKKRFSVPDTLRLYNQKLLNNKLAVFYQLDENRNAKIIIDKNGNMDLSDDEILTLTTTAHEKKSETELDIPVKLYNAATNSVKDSVVALKMFARLNPQTSPNANELFLKFSTRKSLTAEIDAKNFKYIFSWVPLLSPSRKYLGSELPLQVDIIDKNNSMRGSRFLNLGDTVTIDQYKTIVRQYNGDQLILETQSKALTGYEVGQILNPIAGVDIFDLDKKIDLSSNRYLVLDFWGTWCAPCIDAMPELVLLEKKY
ncbi:MAG: hypothetical protein EOO07_02530 [Chitinophagaceae bacterium]|nr:MAG: hypothetical protein EOO07_02530 [Chitinophagaceae bacterium]